MKKFLTVFGPGLLVAATGVGAGDLATSALAGSSVGYVVLSAVIIGGIFKYLLNVGLARWQYSTDKTLIEGAMEYYGSFMKYLFLIYLVVWSFTVGVALISASGIALHAIFPVFEDPATGKFVFGVGLSLLGIVFIRYGGYRFFENTMSTIIILMVFTVVLTAFKLKYDWSANPLPASFISIPKGAELPWYLAILGGVGGTVTILCYGYWIKEKKRTGSEGLKTSRIDLLLAYGVTILLGVCMVLIGSRVQISGSGANLLVELSRVLESENGLVFGWIFRLGAFAAIFSSLLGVWQSVPYLFADLMAQMKKTTRHGKITESKWYDYYLLGLGIIPIIGVPIGFVKMQKLYAICGALFIPFLALTLILLHFQSAERKGSYHNSVIQNVLYGLIFLFFIGLGVRMFL